MARFASGTSPSFDCLTWNPVIEFFFSFPPPIDCLTIEPPLIFAAQAVPARAATRAITDTTSAGEGRALLSLLIGTPLLRYFEPRPVSRLPLRLASTPNNIAALAKMRFAPFAACAGAAACGA